MNNQQSANNEKNNSNYQGDKHILTTESDNRLTLLRIRDERGYTHRDLARILGKSLHTIKAYTLHPGSACYRPIPDSVLEILTDDAEEYWDDEWHISYKDK